MTSPRRRQDRAIESVALKISFRTDREITARIKQAVPSAVARGGFCEGRIEAEHPGEMAEKAKSLLEKIRRQIEPERL